MATLFFIFGGLRPCGRLEVLGAGGSGGGAGGLGAVSLGWKFVGMFAQLNSWKISYDL